ncbi:hypothetical protein [Haliangium sp.]|uniref:hypothetical protein n=1 Tax=Haliangium sp. TaxID=2663208 RepID=UPI003D117E00
MPTVELTSWNVGGAGVLKATAALGQLIAWGAALAPPAGLGAWPGGLAPAGGGAAWRRDVLCEVNGNTLGFFLGLSPGLAPGSVAATAGIPVVGGAATWVAVKHRTDAKSRNAQKGYFGNGAAPQRVHTVRPGAWPGGVTPFWAAYSNSAGAAFGAFPVMYKPLHSKVRGYVARRELVVHQAAPLIIAWYHAISGGGATSVYDLYDVLNWLRQQANAAGGRQVVVLLGDLNLSPAEMQFYLAPAMFGPLAVPPVPGPVQVCPGPVGAPAPALNLAPNTTGILATGLPTHNSGSQLDYAVVMHIDPAPPMAPVNVQAFIECGAAGMGGLAAAPAGGGAFASLAIPGGFFADHRPIKVQLDY